MAEENKYHLCPTLQAMLESIPKDEQDKMRAAHIAMMKPMIEEMAMGLDAHFDVVEVVNRGRKDQTIILKPKDG